MVHCVRHEEKLSKRHPSVEEKDTSCPAGLVSRTGLPMQAPADFMELRLSWAKVKRQLLGVLSSAVGKQQQK